MTKSDVYKVAVLLTLHGTTVMKKQDIMDYAEKHYLCRDHEDFAREIQDGKTAGRKSLEWAVQNSYTDGLISRCTGQQGYYRLTQNGRELLEDFAVAVEEGETPGEFSLLTEQAVKELCSIAKAGSKTVAQRQAEAVAKMLE